MVLRLIRPFLRWIGLLTLNLRHLTNRMFLARRGKQGHGKENGEDALANEKSHNALAQLSVSGRARKIKAQW
ncbi:MAG TPA: hypothetical protein VIW07_02620 [Candidatus Udaeobacter sp.]